MKQQTKQKIKAGLLTGIMGVATVVAPLAFTACDNGTTPQQQLDGSESQKSGYTVSGMTNAIDIIKEIGVTDAQMMGVLTSISNIYQIQGWIDLCKDNFENGMITKISIVPGSELTKNGTVLKIGCLNIPDDIDEFMVEIAYGVITLNKSNAIKLAKQLDGTRRCLPLLFFSA